MWDCITLRTEHNVVSRKRRACDYCREVIEVGERHVSAAGVWNGDFYAVRYHPECLADLNDAAVEYGGLYEYMPGEPERPFVHGGEGI